MSTCLLSSDTIPYPQAYANLPSEFGYNLFNIHGSPARHKHATKLKRHKHAYVGTCLVSSTDQKGVLLLLWKNKETSQLHCFWFVDLPWFQAIQEVSLHRCDKQKFNSILLYWHSCWMPKGRSTFLMQCSDLKCWKIHRSNAIQMLSIPKLDAI